MADPSLPPELIEKLLAALGGQPKTMTDMELALEKLKDVVGQTGLDELLERLGPEDDSPKACPRCGKQTSVRRKKVHRLVHSLSGEHDVVRNYHFCGECDLGFFPRDAELGLPSEGSVTFETERRLLDFGVNDPFEECSQRWSVHYRRKYSEKMFRSVVERVGRRLEASDEDIAQRQLQPTVRAPAERLYVQNDGGMVPMTDGSWREVKLGMVFRDAHHAAGDGRQRGQISRARYTGVLGEQEEFKKALKVIIDSEGWKRAREVAWLGDGAKGNWTLAESLCPNAIQILDIRHAIEHEVDCGKALLGESSEFLPLWQERIERLVYGSDMNATVRELMECLLVEDNPFVSKAVGALVGYYRNNQERMDYAAYRERGPMIGSGAIESAHRHVIQKRMKLAGQHWSESHGRRMVRLRAAQACCDPERIHQAINTALCKTYLRKLQHQQRAA